ncbi:lipoyl(octanoyl) transferase LipB [bacterium]|nr:lipoyl(octanoyl) transferase LipB [bacterium]
MQAESLSGTRPAWYRLDIPRLEYRSAWALQHRLAQARREGRLQRDEVILLEHPPVYTLGRRGGEENLMVSAKFLRSKGIEVVPVERGGNITYHGPGQLVMYPIVNLREAGLKVVDFVGCLEEIMIRAAAAWGVEAERNPLNRGVWVGRSKLGALGITVRRSVSFHGLAFNVNTDLEPFDWINPCGLSGVEVTSLQKETGKPLPMEEVRKTVWDKTAEVFEIDWERVPDEWGSGESNPRDTEETLGALTDQ